MKKVMLALLMMTYGNAYAAGIPVFDGANLMQTIMSVQQLKEQLDQQKQIYQAMNGSRGLGKLLNDPSLRNYLPADWQTVYDNLSKGGLSGITGSAAVILKSTQHFDCTKLKEQNSRLQCEKRAGKIVQDKAFGLAAYEQSARRVEQIEALMGKINETADAKAIAELNARLQAENALIQNEQIKLQLFQYLSQVQDKAIEQEKRERTLDLMKRPADIRLEYKKFE